EINRNYWLACRRRLESERDGNANRAGACAIIIKKIFRLITAMRHLAEECTHEFFRIFLQLSKHAMYAGKTVSGRHIKQASSAGVACGNLRVEIAFPLLRRTDVVQQQAKDIFLRLSGGYQLDGRNTNAFLIDLAANSHGTCIGPAHVSMVRARSHVKRRLLWLLA